MDSWIRNGQLLAIVITLIAVLLGGALGAFIALSSSPATSRIARVTPATLEVTVEAYFQSRGTATPSREPSVASVAMTPTNTATGTPTRLSSLPPSRTPTPRPSATATTEPTLTATSSPTVPATPTATPSPLPSVTAAPTRVPPTVTEPTNTATAVPPTVVPALPAPLAREPRAHRNSSEPVTFEWDYPTGPLPEGYEFTVVLRGPDGQEYRPASCAQVRSMPCVVPAPPPAGSGPYEWWVLITQSGVPSGVESNHLAFPWEVPAQEPPPPAPEPTEEPPTPEPPPPPPEPTKEPPPTPIP